MVRITTLNELSQLGRSDFNQPNPRHGLRLLYWFAQEQNQLSPTSGAYGFHRFHNRIDDDDDDRLLPNQNLPYYAVGNLNATRAEELPRYVRSHNSNKDRIIVRLNGGRIDRVYVTEHEDWKEFNSSRTYRVSQGLLNQISWMDKEQFLNQMEQQRKPWFTNQNTVTNYSFQEQSYTPRLQSYSNQQPEDNWSCCKLLLRLLGLLLIVIVIVMLFLAAGSSRR